MSQATNEGNRSMRNPFRRRTPRNVVNVRAADGTVIRTVYLNPPTKLGPNVCDIVISCTEESCAQVYRRGKEGSTP